MSQDLIVVTGATGNIGAKLTVELLKKGRKVRAVGRDAGKLKPLAEKGAETTLADLNDRAAVAKALAGAKAVFAMIPPNYGAPDFRAYQNRVGESLSEGISASGASHVVFLSSVGADKEGAGLINGIFDAERRFNALKAHVLFLRPAYFMENHLNAIPLIKAQGFAGGGIKGSVSLPMIATKDIAAAAAELLASLAFTGKSVRELLGPKDYTMAEAMRALGAAVGKPDLKYVDFPLPDVVKVLQGLGFSADVARLFAEMMDAFNSGRARPTQPRGPATATPTTLESFAPVFAGAFRA